MTIKLSTGLRNMLVGGIGFQGAFNRGRIEIRSGSQPANADSPVSGTLLGTVSAASATWTAETAAYQTIVVSGTISGTINNVLVNTLNIIPDGTVAARVDATTTAADLADAINRNGYYRATSSGATVTVTARPGSGTGHNTYSFTVSATTITATAGGATLVAGSASANGLLFASPVPGTTLGVLSKSSNQVWSFNGAVAGTAGWARFYGPATDDGSTTSLLLPRLDGSVATSGGDFNLSNIVIAVGVPNTMDTFTWTQPAS